VRCDHRFGADRNGIVERLVGDVRYVDQHSQAIHLLDDLLAEIGESIVLRLVCGGIGPFVVAEVGERHSADPQAMVHAQHRHVVADLMAAFERQYNRQLAGLGDALDVAGIQSLFRFALMRIEHFLRGVPEVEGPPHRFAAPCNRWECTAQRMERSRRPS